MRSHLLWFCLLLSVGFFTNDLGADETNSVISTNNTLETKDTLIPVLKKYFQSRQYAKAQGICLKLITIEPANAGLHQLSGLIYVQQTNYDKALPSFQKAFDLGRIDALHHIVEVNLARKDWQAVSNSISLMLEYKSKDPNLVDDLVNLSVGQHPPNKKLFYEAVGELSNDQIVEAHKDNLLSYVYGFDTFGDHGRAKQLSLRLKNIISKKQ